MDTPTLPPMKPADKYVGYGLLVLLAVGGFFVLPPLFIVLVALAQNMMIFAVECVVLATLAIIFLDPNTWHNIYYKWQNISRNMRKAIIREDPIGILRTVISRFAAKLTEIDSRIAEAEGAAHRQSDAITKAEKESARELSLAKTARNTGHPEAEVQQHAASAKRWQDAADGMKPMRDTLFNVQTCMERARDLCSSRLEDTKNQMAVMSIKLEALKDGQKAVKSFKRFFGTNPDLEMQDLAVEEIERQSAEAEAEIDQFMRTMNPMLASQDLQKNADALQAMEKFKNYLGSASPTALLPEAPSTTVVDITEHKQKVAK